MLHPWMTDALTNYVRDESRTMRLVSNWESKTKVGNLARKESDWPHKKEQKRGIEMFSTSHAYTLASSRSDASDDSWLELIAIKLGFKALSIVQDEKKKSWSVDVIDLAAEGAAARHVWKAVKSDPKIEKFVFSAAPAAARVGDLTVHGTPVGPGLGSPNVLIGGMPALRSGVDMHVCGLSTPNPHLGGAAISSQTSVFVNGFPLLRAGDAFIEGGGGPNPIAMGCPSVHVGSPAPSVDVVASSEPEPGSIDIELDFIVSVFWGKGVAKLGAELGGQRGIKEPYAKLEGRASVVRISPKGKILVHRSGGPRPYEVPFEVGLNFLSWGKEYDSRAKVVSVGNAIFALDVIVESGDLVELSKEVF